MLTEAGVSHSFVGGSTINTTIPTTKKEDAKYLGSRSYTNPGESFITQPEAPPEDSLRRLHRDVQVEELTSSVNVEAVRRVETNLGDMGADYEDYEAKTTQLTKATLIDKPNRSLADRRTMAEIATADHSKPLNTDWFAKAGFSSSCLQRHSVVVSQLAESAWRTEGCGKTFRIGTDQFHATVCQFGATLVSVMADGKELTLNYPPIREPGHFRNDEENIYFGVTNGRVAGRIAKGKFELNDTNY